MMVSSQTLNARSFNQDLGGAKKMALRAPLFITNQGKTSHVLMSYQHFQKLSAPQKSLVDLLSMNEELDFEAPKLSGKARKVTF